MNNTANKKDFFYIVVLILTFITVIIGATFAIYSFVKSPQEEGASAVYTGTLSIEYLSGEIISFNYLYPTEKPTIDTEENVYKNNFKVTNTGSLDCEIDIFIDLARKDTTFINEDEDADSDEDKDIRLHYLLYTKVGEEVSESHGRINGIDNEEDDQNDIIETQIANNITLKSNESVEYTLIIWIAELGKNQPNQMGKELKGQIRVKADQIKK